MSVGKETTRGVLQVTGNLVTKQGIVNEGGISNGLKVLKEAEDYNASGSDSGGNFVILALGNDTSTINIQGPSDYTKYIYLPTAWGNEGRMYQVMVSEVGYVGTVKPIVIALPSYVDTDGSNKEDKSLTFCADNDTYYTWVSNGETWFELDSQPLQTHLPGPITVYTPGTDAYIAANTPPPAA